MPVPAHKPVYAVNRKTRGDPSHSIGLSVIFTVIERPIQTLVVIAAVLILILGFLGFQISFSFRFIITFAFLLVLVAVATVGGLIKLLYDYSRIESKPVDDWAKYLTMKNAKLTAEYKGKKLPIDHFVEDYIAGQADLKEGVDLYELFLKRNGIFSYAITENHMRFYCGTFLTQNLMHTTSADKGEVAPVYNIGNDFYNWFLGDAMLYSCAIYEDLDEKIEDAQKRKLDLICNYAQMKQGDRHLDFGCGWGSMICHAAKNFGTFGTGITLSTEQADYCHQRAKEWNVENQIEILVQDYRTIPRNKYKVITCLEMSEHVGIKNYQAFLAQVYDHLEDDGIFYLQIAGLRRAWQMEDLTWGMFMAKYIFPAADASCPLGWDIEQVERAGFEVHRVENTGVHYARTIYHWWLNWKKNQKLVINSAKYGQRAWRLHAIFLVWSAIIAAQGSSTVYMITLNKNLKNDALCMDKDFVKKNEKEDLSNIGQEDAQHGFCGSAGHLLNRSSKWIGPKRLQTQQ